MNSKKHENKKKFNVRIEMIYSHSYNLNHFRNDKVLSEAILWNLIYDIKEFLDLLLKGFTFGA